MASSSFDYLAPTPPLDQTEWDVEMAVRAFHLGDSWLSEQEVMARMRPEWYQGTHAQRRALDIAVQRGLLQRSRRSMFGAVWTHYRRV